MQEHTQQKTLFSNDIPCFFTVYRGYLEIAELRKENKLTVEAMVQKAKEGFASISLEEFHKDNALRFLEEWLTGDAYSSYQEQIQHLIEGENWSVLLDSFYRIIPFGTGGRRGAVGVGPNRINPFSLATSVQGHVAFLREKFGEEQLRVVIAFDVRQFHDLRGLYSKDKENPLLGLTSKDFAKQAASVYAAHGVEVLMLDPSESSFISTPELSYLIRAYKAHGGLNVSASHNHPDDNGGKFYNEQGGQPVPPDDQHMSELVSKVKSVHSMDFEEAVANEKIRWIPQEMREKYSDLNASLKLSSGGEDLRILYSPMHGTGSTSVGEVLKKAGFTVDLYQPHEEFDGCFSNVRFHTPNPEVSPTLDEVIQAGKEGGYDLILATDPDADRLGACGRMSNDDWYFFNGNEIGSLLTYYRLAKLKDRGELPQQPIIVKTEVTSNMIKKVTESFGGTCIGNLLVGFKYIGQALHHLETKGEFQGVQGSVDDFILGTEESHGFLITHHVRDKDAAGAALHLAEFANQQKENGSTLHDALMNLYRDVGYCCNRLFSMIMEGATGISKTKRMITSLRENPPTEVLGMKVVEFFDHWDESGRFGSFLSETDKSSRNVLVFHLEDDIRLILRPSGTEPKAKLYVEVPGQPAGENLEQQMDALQAKAKSLSLAFTKEALGRVDISLPTYMLEASDLVSIDNKIWLAEEVFPQWLQATKEALQKGRNFEAVGEWLAGVLSKLGKEPFLLLQQGIEAFIAGQEDADVAESLKKTLP